jgi:hypothetical protein
MSLAGEFGQPTKNKLMNYLPIRLTCQHNLFQPVFCWLQQAAEAENFDQASRLTRPSRSLEPML